MGNARNKPGISMSPDSKEVLRAWKAHGHRWACDGCYWYRLMCTKFGVKEQIRMVVITNGVLRPLEEP